MSTIKKKPVSPQRRWQLRQRAAGCCVICGVPAVTANHCLAHAIASREYQRRRSGSRKRYQSASYRLHRSLTTTE